MVKTLTQKKLLKRKETKKLIDNPIANIVKLRTLNALVKEEELSEISEESEEYYSSEDELIEESDPDDSDSEDIERKVRVKARQAPVPFPNNFIRVY